MTISANTHKNLNDRSEVLRCGRFLCLPLHETRSILSENAENHRHDSEIRASRSGKRFLSSECRKRNLAPVRELLPQAEVYIYENAEKVQGVIGLDGKHIEGPFEKAENPCFV